MSYHYAKDKKGLSGLFQPTLLEHWPESAYVVSVQRLDPQATIKDYRRCYFAKLDALSKSVGEGRYDLHEMVKEYIIAEMVKELPDLFNVPLASTTAMWDEGWPVLLERLDLWAFLTYEVVLP